MLDPSVIGSPRGGRRPRPLLRTTLGGVLRQTRYAQRRTLADVARAAKVSMPYLSEVERGRKEASSEVLAAICDALGIDLADLLALAGRDLAGRRAPAGLTRREIAVRPDAATLDAVTLDGSRPDAALPDTVAPDVAGAAPPDPVSSDAALPDVVRLEAVRTRHDVPPAGRSGDARCLLAA